MAPTPSMVVRVAASLEELRKELREGRNEIVVTTAGMQKLADSFSGERIIQQAHNVVGAVREVGGASRLTEAEQARVNATLERAIEKYKVLGQEAPKAMVDLAKETAATKDTLSDLDRFGVQSLGNIGGATDMASGKAGGLTTAYRQVDGVLQSLGISVGRHVKGLEDIVSATDKGTGGFMKLALGVGGAAAAFKVGWDIGRWIAEFTGLDKAVEGLWRQLLNLGNALDQAAAAKQDAINRAIAQGAAVTISYTEAIEFNQRALQKNLDSKINWNKVLADAQREVRNLTEAQIKDIEVAQKAGATTEQLTNKFNVSALALQVLAERQKAASDAANQHREKLEALDKAYAKLMSDVRNENQLAKMMEDAETLRRAAENEAQLRLMERDAWQMEFESRQKQIAQEKAAEEARIAANQAEIDALTNTGAAHRQAGEEAKKASAATMQGYAGVTQQIALSADAIRAWIDLMVYSAEVNAILSENSLFTTLSQRDRIAKLKKPAPASGATVPAPFTGRESAPAAAVPAPAVGGAAAAAGGERLVVNIQPGAVVQHYPISTERSTVEPLMALIRKELADQFSSFVGPVPTRL